MAQVFCLSKCNHKKTLMGNLLYIIAAIFIVGWFIAVYGYNAGGVIHVLLIVGIVAVIVRLISRKKPL